MKPFTAALAVLIVAALCCGSLLARSKAHEPKNSAAGLSGSTAAVTVPWEVRTDRGDYVSPRLMTRRAHLLRHPVRAVRRLTLDTTAYCWTGSRTASGVWPRIGMAASNLFPFGTHLRVPGIGVVTVTDRIGYGSQLDIYMGAEGCEQRAVQFGRRSLLVEVLP